MAVDPIKRTGSGRVGDRCANGPATHHPRQAQSAHQPHHRASSSHDPLPGQLPPHLPQTVDAEVRVEHTLDLNHQGRVATSTNRLLLRIGTPGGMQVVGRRGNWQHPADRLAPVSLSMIADEANHGRDRRSSSAMSKYALALRRISLAWCSSRTSRSSALILSRSSVVCPDRRRESRPFPGARCHPGRCRRRTGGPAPAGRSRPGTCARSRSPASPDDRPRSTSTRKPAPTGRLGTWGRSCGRGCQEAACALGARRRPGRAGPQYRFLSGSGTGQGWSKGFTRHFPNPRRPIYLLYYNPLWDLCEGCEGFSRRVYRETRIFRAWRPSLTHERARVHVRGQTLARAR